VGVIVGVGVLVGVGVMVGVSVGVGVSVAVGVGVGVGGGATFVEQNQLFIVRLPLDDNFFRWLPNCNKKGRRNGR
jgi:hypothetical protein